MTLESAKGVRDFLPEDKILRDKIVSSLVEVFELFGYNPLETPVLEKLEVLNAKFAAGASTDVAKEIFKLKDQGNRELGLRFDLTVPLSRVIGMNLDLKMPFKRYEIGKTFRDGPIKLGRYREFWQCDVDVIGCSKMTADAELILLALEVFKKLGFDAYIELNNRKLLQGILEYCGVEKENIEEVMIGIDKWKKIGEESVKKELEEKNIDDETFEKISSILSLEGSNFYIIENLRKVLDSELAVEGLREIEEVLAFLDKSEAENVRLNLSLARGLSYYTGTVFEGFLKNSQITSSICGGGRYDKMIGLYSENNREVPAVGISFGLEPITEAIKLMKNKNVSIKKSVAKVFIIPVAPNETLKGSFEIAKVLRDNNIKTDIDLLKRNITKNLEYANTLKIPFVVFVGPDELAEGKIKLRDMLSGTEELLSLEELCERLKA